MGSHFSVDTDESPEVPAVEDEDGIPSFVCIQQLGCDRPCVSVTQRDKIACRCRPATSIKVTLTTCTGLTTHEVRGNLFNHYCLLSTKTEYLVLLVGKNNCFEL